MGSLSNNDRDVYENVQEKKKKVVVFVDVRDKTWN